MRAIWAWGILAVTALPVRADVVDSGNLQIGGQGVFGGSVTVQGSAFSVGGATFSVAGGSVTLGGRLNAAAAGIKWADGTTSTTASSGVSGTVYRSTFVYLCGGNQTPNSGENSQATAVTVSNSTSTLSFEANSWAEVSVTLFHFADGTQYNLDLYVDNARPAWVGSNGILACQGSASSIMGICTAVFPIPISSSGQHTFYWKVWRGGNPVTLVMGNPCSYYTVKEFRGNQ